MKKTYSVKPTEVTRKWILIDAADAPLGRISTVIATYLTGKNKPMYTPHIDCGDFVVVINADKLVVTGNKLRDKMYYRYSGFPGGMKEMTLEQKIEKNSSDVIELSVKGMLPKNALGRKLYTNLKVYKGSAHKQEAQQPELLNLDTLK